MALRHTYQERVTVEGGETEVGCQLLVCLRWWGLHTSLAGWLDEMGHIQPQRRPAWGDLLGKCWLWLPPKFFLPDKAGICTCGGKKAGAGALWLSFLVAGSLLSFIFPLLSFIFPPDGDHQPLSLGDREDWQEQERCLWAAVWCGPVQAAAVPVRAREQLAERSCPVAGSG